MTTSTTKTTTATATPMCETPEVRETREWICITNAGEIDPNAFILLGGGTKRSDEDKIGFFGSGNKYALAYILRNKIPLRVFSGTREIRIETTPVNFRGQLFETVIVNGQTTGLTTETGPDWKCWQAFRELYCNALDEGEAAVDIVEKISPRKGITSIYIDASSEFGAVHANFDDFFTVNRTPAWVDPENRNAFYENPTRYPYNGRAYRRGILCDDSHQVSQFPLPGYDLDLHDFEINESRELKYNTANDKIAWQALLRCTNKHIIAAACENLNESYVPYGVDLSGDNISSEWHKALTSRVVYTTDEKHLLTQYEAETGLAISSNALMRLEDYVEFKRPTVLGRDLPYDEVTPSDIEMRRMQRALDALRNAGVNVTAEIIFGKFYDSNILGMYCRKTSRIVISPATTARGHSDLMLTLLEEHIHESTGARDYTRDFQDTALRIIITMIQDREEN